MVIVLQVIFEYLNWLATERQVSSQTQALVIRSMVATAKFLYHSSSTVRKGDGQSACEFTSPNIACSLQCSPSGKDRMVVLGVRL